MFWGETMKERRAGVQEYAADLRRLRLEAGSPTLTRLQSETGISRSVLSDAFAGKYLPSARTITALVRALRADPEEWIARRDALADDRGADEAAAPVVTVPAGVSRRRGVPLWTAALLGAGGFVLGVVVTVAVATIVASSIFSTAVPQADRTSAEPRISVATGEDPTFTDCLDDAEVAASEIPRDGALLEIVWSEKCNAGWGRITRFDGRAGGNTVSVAIYPETAPDGPDRQEATAHDVRGAVTMLVVRPTPETLLCAVGAFSLDGAVVDLDVPVCA